MVASTSYSKQSGNIRHQFRAVSFFYATYPTFLSMCIAEAMVLLEEVVEVWTQSQFARL